MCYNSGWWPLLASGGLVSELRVLHHESFLGLRFVEEDRCPQPQAETIADPKSPTAGRSMPTNGPWSKQLTQSLVTL